MVLSTFARFLNFFPNILSFIVERNKSCVFKNPCFLVTKLSEWDRQFHLLNRRNSFENCIFATITKCNHRSLMSSERTNMLSLLLSLFSSLKTPLILMNSVVFVIPSCIFVIPFCSFSVNYWQHEILKVPERFHDIKVLLNWSRISFFK